MTAFRRELTPRLVRFPLEDFHSEEVVCLTWPATSLLCHFLMFCLSERGLSCEREGQGQQSRGSINRILRHAVRAAQGQLPHRCAPERHSRKINQTFFLMPHVTDCSQEGEVECREQGSTQDRQIKHPQTHSRPDGLNIFLIPTSLLVL